MMPRVSATASGSMSTRNTLAPCRASSVAVALPLPQPGPTEPAPVTIATLPAMLSIGASSWCPCGVSLGGFRAHAPELPGAVDLAVVGGGAGVCFGGGKIRDRSETHGLALQLCVDLGVDGAEHCLA